MKYRYIVIMLLAILLRRTDVAEPLTAGDCLAEVAGLAR
jgi:hypothetical protein